MITQHKLDNGIRLVVEEITDIRSVAIGIWINTGSRYESLEINGVSHFIEHLLFKGTKNRNAKEIAETIDNIGGHLNAFTSKEYTCYYTRVIDQHIEIGLDLLSDILFNSTLIKEEIDRERNVVLEEIKMYEDTPDDQIHDLISACSYEGNSLGYSVLGEETSLHKLTREKIISYMQDKYNSSNIVISIAGKVSSNIIDLVGKYFNQSGCSGTENSAIPAYFSSNLMLKEKDTEQAHIALAFPGLAVNSDSLYTLNLLNNLFGGSMSSMLFQEVREKCGLAYSVYSYHSAYKDTGQFTIYAGTNPKNIDQLIEVIYRTINRALTGEFTDIQIEKGKEQMKGSLVLGMESTVSRMVILGRNEIQRREHLEVDEIIKKIEAISLVGVNEILHNIFVNNHSVALIGPIATLPSSIRSDYFANSKN